MTYKEIVKVMVEEKATRWVEALLPGEMVIAIDTELQNDKEFNTIFWKTTVSVHGWQRVIVGGTADNLGIFESVIWSEDGEPIWHVIEGSRKALGIMEFKIA